MPALSHPHRVTASGKHTLKSRGTTIPIVLYSGTRRWTHPAEVSDLDVRSRLASASLAQLGTWSLNILDAETLGEVFGD